MIDVTDTTFEKEVLERSTQVPVVIDLWAPWCGPCRTLGPILEKVVEQTQGKVELVKVNVDENPAISNAFKVQSIPSVFAIKDRKVVDSFMGALPEHAISQFIANLDTEPSEIDNLIAKGDEISLRQVLEIDAENIQAAIMLAQLLIDKGDNEAALEVISKVPENLETKKIIAVLKLGGSEVLQNQNLESQLDDLLAKVKHDPVARQQYLDILDAIGPENPKTSYYRRQLTSQLF